MSTVAAGITADSVLIGGASAQASARGEDDADTGDWAPGDSERAAEAAAGLGLASLIAGDESPDTASGMEDGYLGAVSRVLAGWDGAGEQDEGDLGDALADAVADPDYASGLTLTQVTTIAGLAALQWYLGQTGLLLQWTAVGDSRTCPACLQNSLADPRPAGVPWPSGATAPPQHPGGCRCGLAAVSS